MSDYRPPVSDLAFILEHIVDYDEIAEFPGFEHADLDTVTGLLSEAGDFAAEVVAPTNRAGDLQGAVRNPDATVTTSPGFKEAYAKLVEAGWASLPFPEEFEGGGFPAVVGLAIQEMLLGANMAFSLAPLLTQGAIDALLSYGSDAQKKRYLPHMVSGEWSGTMNLTEPQAGSDVGALVTKAVPRADGTFGISGQKIFITYGEHDMAEQIVHLVLARTPDAPAGTAGISCFIVPKFLVNDDESLGERNGVQVLSLEHKLGIHGSPTCVMEYDDATGYLIGDLNKGMRIMFVMMNSARLSVGNQGVALSERAYQQSLDYAQVRRQGARDRAERHGGRRPDHRSPRCAPDAGDPEDLHHRPAQPDALQRGHDRPEPAPPGRERARPSHRGGRAADPDLQVDGDRPRQRAHLARAADPRRHGLHRRDRGGAALPRHPDRRHLRGHERHPGGRPDRAQARRPRRSLGDRVPRLDARARRASWSLRATSS